MNGIVIDKISYMNYRQYGTGSITFNQSKEYALSLLIAQNGTGKTTFLNSITWCLYGKEYQLSDENKSLPVVNTKQLSSANEGEIIPTSVTLSIVDGNKYVEFKRELIFKVSVDSKGVKQPIPHNSKLTVSSTIAGEFSNTKVTNEPDANMIVKQYFHDDIHDFYFFDGEQLKQFFAPGREKDIKRSIYNISQVSLLENVCEHVSIMKKESEKTLAKDSPDIDELIKKREHIEGLKSIANKTIESCEGEVKKLEKEVEKIDAMLKEYAPIKKLQDEREKLESLQQRNNTAYDAYRSDVSFINRHYTVLLKFYPRIKRILDYINKKEEAGELPPSIDIDLVKMLLNNLDKKCPLCDHDIDESGRMHLENLLKQYSVSSKTSNYLNSIKGPLEVAAEEVKAYKKKREELRGREAALEEEERRITARLKEINAILINYENSDEKEINIVKLESDRNFYRSNINSYNITLGSTKNQIKGYDDQINDINKKIIEAQKKIEQNNEEKKRWTVLSMLNKNYNLIMKNITGGMKEEIENTTREIFESMNWKTQTFGALEIEEDYAISVYSQEGLLMTGSLGATEQMALAYSFILAIHQASGKNCPLVIDSPIGRSSDENRERIAEALLNISKDKQIIMLFTPDDYTVPVMKIFDGKVDIRTLMLSKDEKFVEGIDR